MTPDRTIEFKMGRAEGDRRLRACPQERIPSTNSPLYPLTQSECDVLSQAYR
jgi:hypothetical protein